MKKTKSAVVAIAVMVAFVLVVGWAFAHGPWGARGHGHRGRDYDYPYQSLSPEQREKLQAQEERFYQDTAELRRELYRKRLELQGLWVDPKANPEKIKAKQREVSELQRRIQEKALEHQLAIRELLPDEEIGQGAWCPGHGRGYGYHHGWGHMWGHGSGFKSDYGKGRCW